MGMDFSGRSAAVGMPPEAFLRLVEIAKLYGWQPTGTVMIDEYQYARRRKEVGFKLAIAEAERESGIHRQTYFGNDPKIITAVDAKEFAEGLRKALDHLQREVRFIELLESGPVVSS
jgi:hypothetical protein